MTTNNKRSQATTESGKKLTFFSPLEHRQANALEEIASEIALLLQANDKNAGVLLQMISKIKMETPNLPEPIKKWNFSVSRNNEGFIRSITAEAI